MKLSFRSWLTIITLVLLTIVVVAAWPEIRKAWALLAQVDVWILLLLIPVQLASYYATGGMIFSYLRAKGEVKDMGHWSMARLALELNFVNHILPSGGAAGFSYLAWVLSRHKVSVSRSTMAQIVRFALTFISFVLLLAVAMIVLTFNHQIDRTIVIIGSVLMVVAIGATLLGIWLIRDLPRLRKFSAWLTKISNGFVSWITRGKKKNVVKPAVLLEFFDGLHDDFMAIRRDRKILFVPFLWAIVANILDVALIWIAFWSLGYPVDIAILFVAFGIASIAGAISVTPGGTGVYEAVMVAFLAASNVPADIAIAGTLLARVMLLSGTILFGYVFYQLTILKYGKRTTPTDS
ncbi:MAG: lysylphosphatidylglycerol synthase transmembrane domain-containing protein [Candidatus Microsaccharimonas sp.]